MDLVDPDYDFIKDKSSPEKERYWDDNYPHELLGYAPYDGLLVSKAIVGGHIRSGKYTESQAMRFKRVGARSFLRFEEKDYPNTVIWGDCGAFTYANEEIPPYSVDDILEFYGDGQFTHGCSVDHIIFDFFETEFDFTFENKEVLRRQEICLSNAAEFISKAPKVIGSHFTPVGVVHGWSPKSMADAATKMVKMGYKYLALGGMVPLKSSQIMSALNAVRAEIPKDVELHILGFAKSDDLNQFIGKGINSIDTTSPLLRAFKDNRNNYYQKLDDGYVYYAAIRVPQALVSNELKKLVKSGSLDLDKAVILERQTLNEIRAYASNGGTYNNALHSLREYWELILTEKAKTNQKEANQSLEKQTSNALRTLKDRPWEKCECSICKKIGVDVVIFRGNNRNRRRGFHNLHVYYQHIKEVQRLSK
ncbi:tRNA-guanine transglycosylase DpdA [Alphaproteobacteria bacterium]|nr:tRNA-guanine transglycosylase DpdA [Alphaproteobacteria bacterium]